MPTPPAACHPHPVPRFPEPGTIPGRTRLPLAAALLCLLTTAVGAQAPPAVYWPAPGDGWASRPAAQIGMDPALVDSAVAFALASEQGWTRDMAAQIARTVASEPYPEILGPVKDWGGVGGMIIRHGYIVAEWGDVHRVDMTFSVAKSYLNVVAGLAYDRGLLPDLHAPVGTLIRDGGFDGPHNGQITWHHHLNQTSEWEGTLWDKPDVADRRRGRDRTLETPGTFWEYNDVRVNRLALSLLRLFQRPLPDVLREHIMDPIGATRTWEWHGYRNSYVDLGGRQVQSVSGGGHWGGGVWASTRDHGRFGYLMLRRGQWNGQQLLSEQWIDLSLTPTPIRPVYGYMWWLNSPEAKQYPNATARSFFALGSGGNVIWIAPELDLVVVTRWMDTRRINEFMGRVVASVVQP